jgi:hypothetical protein
VMGLGPVEELLVTQKQRCLLRFSLFHWQIWR